MNEFWMRSDILLSPHVHTFINISVKHLWKAQMKVIKSLKVMSNKERRAHFLKSLNTV